VKSSTLSFFLLLVSYTTPQQVSAQFRTPVIDITARMNNEYASLKETFGIKKRMPREFEKQILIALSYYPELKNTKINFILKKDSSGIISTRPEWISVFKNSKYRSYVVYIGDSSATQMPIFLLRKSPVNGQVGIIGHELAHILYFSRKNSLGLIGTGMAHISRGYMDDFENKTDSICIERGLGYQLLDWNIYFRKAFNVHDVESGPDPFFTDTTRERYMSPARIRQVMGRSERYKDVSSK